jgi:hypothetical protein
MTIASVAYSSVPLIPLNDFAARVRLRDAADGVGGRASSVPAGLAEVNRNHRLNRLPVPGYERAQDLVTHHAGHGAELRRVRRGLRPVVGRQPRRPVVHHHGGEDIGRLEPRLQGQDFRGLRLRREPGLGVVLLGARQLAGQRAGRGQYHYPCDEDHPFPPTPAREAN